MILMLHLYRGISCVQVVDGSSALLWKDLWLPDTLENSHPRAFSFAKDEDISIKSFLESMALHDTFHLPLSPEALAEVQHLQHLSTHLSPSTSSTDVWYYTWGAADFKAADYYKFCFRHTPRHPTFQLLWRSKCTMRIKVFGWPLLVDRLNTRNMLKRRHYDIGDVLDCLLCGQNTEETVNHMIFTCPFSRACWEKVDIHWPTSQSRLDLLDQTNRDDSRPFFMEIFLIAAWSLWKERNNKHFRRINPSTTSWLTRFKEDFSLLQHRVKESQKASVIAYCNSIN